MTKMGMFNFAFKNPFDAVSVFDYPKQIQFLYNSFVGPHEKKIDDIATNLCYDRFFCKAFNIDYCNITRKDYLFIKEYVIKILSESKGELRRPQKL